MRTLVLYALLLHVVFGSLDHSLSVPYKRDSNGCNTFNGQYGVTAPTIASSESNQQITISVSMIRNSLDNAHTPVFHRLDTKEQTVNLCITAAPDLVFDSADASWVATTNGCVVTYVLTQTMQQILSTTSENNNWSYDFSTDGLTITYTLPIYTTYSINDNSSCYFVAYSSKVSFQTKLQEVSTTAEFVSADSSVRFAYSGVTNDPNVGVQGTLYPLVPNSELRNMKLTRNIGTGTFTSSLTQCNVTAGCSVGFYATSASLGGAGTDISGNYTLTVDVYEDNVLTRANITTTFYVSYSIPPVATYAPVSITASFTVAKNVVGDASLIPRPVIIGSMVLYSSPGVTVTAGLSLSNPVSIPKEAIVQSASVTFDILYISAPVEIGVVFKDADGVVQGTVPVTIKSSGKITVDISALYTQLLLANQQSFSIRAIRGSTLGVSLGVNTQNVAVNLDTSDVATAVTYSAGTTAVPTTTIASSTTTTVTPTSTQLVLTPAPTPSKNMASIIICYTSFLWIIVWFAV
jgi:ferredoxin-like protein FixX